MRNGAIAAMLVAFVALGMGAGYFIGVNTITTENGAGSKSLETFSDCTIMDPSKGITIRLTDGTSAVGGASVTIQDISTCYAGTVPRVVAHYDITTNSTGWASACSEFEGNCNFSIRFSGENYSLSVPLTPGIFSYVYYDLRTGNVTVITQ